MIELKFNNLTESHRVEDNRVSKIEFCQWTRSENCRACSFFQATSSLNRKKKNGYLIFSSFFESIRTRESINSRISLARIYSYSRPERYFNIFEELFAFDDFINHFTLTTELQTINHVKINHAKVKCHNVYIKNPEDLHMLRYENVALIH